MARSRKTKGNDFEDSDLPNPAGGDEGGAADGHAPDGGPPSRRMDAAERKIAELRAALVAATGVPVFGFPPDLPEDHKPYWVLVVNSKAHDYFNKGDYALLKMYCRAAWEVDMLSRDIDAEGHTIPNAKGNMVLNPKVSARAIAETRLLSLSTKLRVQPASRFDSENDKKQTQKAARAASAAKELTEQETGGRPGRRKSRDLDDDDLLATPSLPRH